MKNALWISVYVVRGETERESRRRQPWEIKGIDKDGTVKSIFNSKKIPHLFSTFEKT